jgi:hypothetical protein
MPERRRPRIAPKTRGGGIGAKLGVYDDIFLCLSPEEPWLEHGIVEHRYKELCPAAYLEMIDRWGHVSQGPRRYSVTAFLTRAWSQLARDGILATKLGPATGLYQHNGSILYWAFPPGPEAHRIRTWADFAADLGLSPYVWTLPGEPPHHGASDPGSRRDSPP